MSSSSRDSSNFGGNKYQQSGLMDTLLSLHNYTMRHLKVASIGRITSIDTSNKLVSVEPLPLYEDESSKSIYCMCMQGFTETGFIDMLDYLDEDDIVLVLYLDRKSDDAMTNLRNGLKANTISKNLTLHSESYGVIIGLMQKGGK